MSTTRAMKHEQLRQEALANIDLLFAYWKLDYIKISDDEYDFLNPTRDDKNFGACRFNISKGIGADFTGVSLTEHDFKQIGLNFDKSDFYGITSQGSVSAGYDIIGLVQRLFKCGTYTDAAKLLKNHLDTISKDHNIKKITLLDVVKREQARDEQKLNKLQFAKKVWNLCVPIKGTLGEKYLLSRNIHLKNYPDTMRFHPRVTNTETKTTLPALLFSVSREPNGALCAIHRIYLDPTGSGKAKVNNPKMALGDIEGAVIWFGEESDTLCIVEGPENALSILSLGYTFVVSTINAANFSNVSIPPCVNKVILFPDGDDAGHNAARKASIAYNKFDIKINYPPKKQGHKKYDWNDMLMEVRGNGEE